MRALVQRVSRSSVTVESKEIASINKGLLILLGIYSSDTEKDILKLCKKILNLRIFNDSNNKICYNIQDIKGEILLISQFTLCANVKKGNRPSFIDAMPHSEAGQLFERVAQELNLYISTKTGQFGATMSVSLINEGPMTIMIDTDEKNK
tara:strand:- start:267 stop:716 length:450 start_codon:yes stop_codon:yes gene_type:complete